MLVCFTYFVQYFLDFLIELFTYSFFIVVFNLPFCFHFAIYLVSSLSSLFLPYLCFDLLTFHFIYVLSLIYVLLFTCVYRLFMFVLYFVFYSLFVLSFICFILPPSTLCFILYTCLSSHLPLPFDIHFTTYLPSSLSSPFLLHLSFILSPPLPFNIQVWPQNPHRCTT